MQSIIKNIALIVIIIQLTCLADLGMANNSVRVIRKEKRDETLIRGKIDIGWYVGASSRFTELKDDFACLLGLRGGLIINHAFVIGAGGYGIVNNIEVSSSYSPATYLLKFGYGGVFLEYIVLPRKLFHLSIHSLIGGGCQGYRTRFYEDLYEDGFFVVEPGADLMLNITKNVRLGMGGTYRFINGTDMQEYTNTDVSGPTASITLKIGEF